MLTIEYDAPGVLEVTVDAQGVEELMHILRKIEPGDHEHLLTASWGGYPLTEEFPHLGLEPIHKVTIEYAEAEPPNRSE